MQVYLTHQYIYGDPALIFFYEAGRRLKSDEIPIEKIEELIGAKIEHPEQDQEAKSTDLPLRLKPSHEAHLLPIPGKQLIKEEPDPKKRLNLTTQQRYIVLGDNLTEQNTVIVLERETDNPSFKVLCGFNKVETKKKEEKQPDATKVLDCDLEFLFGLSEIFDPESIAKIKAMKERAKILAANPFPHYEAINTRELSLQELRVLLGSTGSTIQDTTAPKSRKTLSTTRNGRPINKKDKRRADIDSQSEIEELRCKLGFRNEGIIIGFGELIKFQDENSIRFTLEWIARNERSEDLTIQTIIKKLRENPALKLSTAKK